MSVRKVQYTITLGALLLSFAHILWPSLTIDGITLSLVVIAIIPWLAPLLKSLKLPGGFEVEFKDMEDRLEKAGLLPPESKMPLTNHAFLIVANEDPNLALAGLRIEIEKRLTILAERTGGLPRIRGVGGLLYQLRDKRILSNEQLSVLADIVGLLNAAVHGAQVKQDAASWAMNVGPKLLAELDRLIEQYK